MGPMITIARLTHRARHTFFDFSLGFSGALFAPLRTRGNVDHNKTNRIRIAVHS